MGPPDPRHSRPARSWVSLKLGRERSLDGRAAFGAAVLVDRSIESVICSSTRATSGSSDGAKPHLLA
jgi:hypothetical protein